jgi:maleate isomerase
MLGIILPDDGPQRYEWYDLADWLAARRLPRDLVGVAGSACDGRHIEASLRQAGAPETLASPGRDLAARGARAVVWACSSGSFIGGLAWAEAQAADLAAAAGRPATSTALALVQALGHLGAEQVDLLSPYPEPVTQRLIGFLAEAGLRTGATRSLDCAQSADSHALDLDAVLAAQPPGTRPLLLPDTAIDTLHRLPALEAQAGRPVVTANQATLWAGLRLIGAPTVLPDAGRLFAA